MIFVKNISGSTKTWNGQQIANGSYFHLNTEALLESWGNDLTFLQALMSATPEAKLAYDNTGSNDIDDQVLSLDLLRSEFVPQKTQAVLGTDNKKTLIHGKSGGVYHTFTKTQTGTFDIPVESKYLNGGIIRLKNPVWGDFYTLDLGDKDAVVVPQAAIDAAGGFYPVASSQMKNVPITFGPDRCFKDGTDLFVHLNFESPIISDPIPTGLYYRMTYTSVGTVEDVGLAFTLKGFNDK